MILAYLPAIFFTTIHGFSLDDYAVSGYTLIETQHGMVLGQTNEDVHAFYSIPYAQPPVGDFRFQAPMELAYNSDLINASMPDYTMCYGDNYKSESSTRVFTEDCLVLTVSVPATLPYVEKDQMILGSLPVMVYLHGGALSLGSGNDPKYSGRYLASKTDTIIVTINYRLGALGFLVYDADDGKVDGNMGIKDQQQALIWIQNNIQQFGGDKNKVTVFGNSAGAQSLAILLATESSSDPLFHRAILQSYPAATQYKTVDEEIKTSTTLLMELLGCTTIACLREVTPEEIFSLSPMIKREAENNGDVWTSIEPFKPVIDGQFLKGQPLELFRDGMWSTEKEIIIGTNSDEEAALLASPMTYDEFKDLSELYLGKDLAQYAMQKYSIFVIHEDDYSVAAANELRDLLFSCPTRAMTRFISLTTTAASPQPYMYVNEHPSYPPNCPSQTGFTACGYAYHGSEVPYVFKTGLELGYNFTVNDLLISDMFGDYWTSFAKNGKPNPFYWTKWNPYSIENDNHLRIKAPNSEEQNEYLKEMCDWWDSTGFYIDSNESPTTTATTSIYTTLSDSTTTTLVDYESTTSGSQRLCSMNLLFFLSILLLSFFVFI